MTKVIAHRGASGYAPENTLKAFERAMEFKVDGIELDVHLSSDGHLIVCHDEKIDRTTNGNGFIKDLTLKEIKKFDAGSWFDSDFAGEQIPTLQEVFELVKRKGLLLNIELKSGPIIYPDIEKKVIGLIEDYGYIDNTIISSFNHYSLVEVKKINRSIKTAPLYMAAIVEPWNYAKKISADGIHPYFYNITPELVKECIKNGLFINPFTVDNPLYLDHLIACGTSGVITNYPDRAFAAIKNKTKD